MACWSVGYVSMKTRTALVNYATGVALTVGVALDLDYHLLEAEDGLLPTVLWNLVLEVVVGALAVLTHLLLLLVIEAAVEVVLEVLRTLLGASLRVDTCLSTVPLLSGSHVGGISWVT